MITKNYIQRAMLLKSCIATIILGITTGMSGVTLTVHAQSAVPYTTTTFPGRALDLLKRGRERFQRGNYRGAIEDFNQAILLNPNDANIYFNRGLVLFKLGDQLGALDDFDSTLLRNPRYARAYFHRGGIRHTLGDEPGAIKDFRLAAILFQSQGDRTRYRQVQKLIKQLER